MRRRKRKAEPPTPEQLAYLDEFMAFLEAGGTVREWDRREGEAYRRERAALDKERAELVRRIEALERRLGADRPHPG